MLESAGLCNQLLAGGSVYSIVKHRYWWFLLSALVIVPGLVALALWGLPRSIDFTGGALYEVQFADPSKVTEEALREIYDQVGVGDVSVVEARNPATGQLTHQIRSQAVESASGGASRKEDLSKAMRERFGDFTELRFESVGASVGQLVTRNASIAVVMAALGILLYLSLAFYAVPHPFRYGTTAIIAMLHDVLVVVGLAAITGHFLGWQVNALFLTALLTIIGFSVHDTIVVFDRIRENLGRMRGVPFERVVNHSIVQTLVRSLNTQLTAVFTLVAVLAFSHGHLRQFVFWLIVGIVSGTYSSIFNAAQLLVVWENREWRQWFGRGRKAQVA